MIRLIVVTIYMVLAVLFVGIPYILFASITGNIDALYWMGVRVLRGALWLGGVQVRIEGTENIPMGVCVFVANHTSNSDPPAAVIAIPRRVALLAKKEVFRIPVVATALRLASIVPVDRADRDAAVASVEKAVEHLKNGVSFLVYPEGTRSPDGRLLAFKKGTFVMAIEAGVPVVPMSIAGAHRIMGKKELTIHPGVITVQFHPAINASEYTLDTRNELLARAHAAITSGLPPDQQPFPATGAAS